MILHPYLAEIQLVLHGVVARLAETDLSLFGVLAGCLVVFRVMTLNKKKSDDKPGSGDPPDPGEPAAIRERARSSDRRD